MCEPLPVARADVVSNRAATHMAEFEVEARVPAPPANDFIVGQIRNFVYGTAKASRTDKRAVGAAQTPLGHIVPPRVLQPRQQFVANAIGFHATSDLLDGALPFCFAALAVAFSGNAERQIGRDFGTDLTTNLHQETIGQLRQRQVKTLATARTGAHRSAKTSTGRLSAIDCNEKSFFSASRIVWIEIVLSDEGPVLNVDRRQFTGSHADKCVLCG